MDPPTTYYHAFVYIRQLAVHLRNAISSRSKVWHTCAACLADLSPSISPPCPCRRRPSQWQTGSSCTVSLSGAMCWQKWATTLCGHWSSPWSKSPLASYSAWHTHCSVRPLLRLFPSLSLPPPPKRLLPAHQYSPLRLHCVKSLHLLAREVGVFIPTAPHLLDILRWKGAKPSTRAGQQLMGKPLDLPCILKLTPSQLNSESVQVSWGTP